MNLELLVPWWKQFTIAKHLCKQRNPRCSPKFPRKASGWVVG